MTWKYVPGDLYDLEQLKDFERFFWDDLEKAGVELVKAFKWKKFNLPNWRSNYVRIRMGYDEALDNWLTVLEAIDDTKKRLNITE